jgi:hypothetical protein
MLVLAGALSLPFSFFLSLPTWLSMPLARRLVRALPPSLSLPGVQLALAVPLMPLSVPLPLSAALSVSFG